MSDGMILVVGALGGIAYAAGCWAFISLIMLIYHAIRSASTGDNRPAVATIKELKEETDDAIMESTTYLYNVDVVCDGKTYSSELTEILDRNEPSKYSIGQEITIRFYPKKSKIAEKVVVNKTAKWARRFGIGAAVWLLVFLLEKLLLK